jgi:DNA helicase-2/ATP-dependent DNA helicase PcrA
VSPAPLDPGDLLADLDPSQRDAVTTDATPLAILAGPGSGKTRVLTRRIAWRCATGRIEAQHVLALTFTRKAAGELGDRLRALGVDQARHGVTAGTIHAIALGALRTRAASNGDAMPVLLERKARLLVPLVGGRGREAGLAAAEIASEIEWAKARLIAPQAYAAAAAEAGRTPPRPASEVAALFERYEREKRKRRVLDFDDLILTFTDALEHDTEFAAAQRWRARHLFVDEFQDVSPAQLRLVRALLGDRTDLCVVGDPDQAIYAFAGADPGGLTGFTQRFPGGHTVRLECNYRSTPEIVAAGEALLADAGRSRPARQAVRGRGVAPTVTTYDSDDAEAAGVADRLRRAHDDGVPWRSLAVLYRTNAQSAGFEEALTRARIPYRVRGDGRFLERPEVRAALDALSNAARADRTRTFGDHVADLEAGAADAPEQRRDHIVAVARLARDYAAVEPGPGSIEGFQAFLSTSLRGDTPDIDADAVELLTFHRAKGLEFHTVFVTGLERGLVPISYADTPAERAEERRLLFVAITRAEVRLELSLARLRTLGTRVVNRQRSPWLAPIEEAGGGGRPAEAAPRRGPAAARARLDQARDRLATGDDPTDPELLAALVEWRRNLARASGVPAYVIFHDTTLRAVAEQRPSDRDSLLALPGIGPVKVERHGDAVLDLVRRHAS